MRTIVVRSQADWDALPAKFGESTAIEIRCPEWISISGNPESSHVEAWESSYVVARESSHEDTSNETSWAIGEIKTHPNWNPTANECGPGKYHAVPRPYFADEFRNSPDDRYVAVEIKTADLYAWPDPRYPHKIAFREAVVLYECDRYGNKVESREEVAA